MSGSAKEFLKSRHPKLFSSSKEIILNQLDRVHLEYYLNTLNTRSQELTFEKFLKSLCEKVICPNLLEQTGPVAGGDGKTDTQTFPVSEQLSNLWYEGMNEGSHKERWAFAISTQKNWKQKVKADVKKIIETSRGYSKVFCLTNQAIKASQRSALEDELSASYQIQVVILDINWILDQVYKNKLENLAIDILQIPTNFKRELVLSTEDYDKTLKFENLSKKISNYDPLKITREEVDDFLNIAQVSRELEKPVLETHGLYLRAIRIAEKFGNLNQRFEAYYGLAWTANFWFEDNQIFEDNLIKAFNCLKDSSSSILWADFVSLLTLHISHHYQEIDKSPVKEMVDSTITQLELIANDESRPSNSLLAKIAIQRILMILNYGNNLGLENIFAELLSLVKEGENLIGFAFGDIEYLIEQLSDLFEAIDSYQHLRDYFIEQSIKRLHDVKNGKLLLERSEKIIRQEDYYKAIKIIGKSLAKLNKLETEHEMIDAYLMLSEVYINVDLFWAARSSLLGAASIAMNNWHKTGIASRINVISFMFLAWNELSLGRVMQSIAWYKLTLLFNSQLKENALHDDTLINYDGCLAHLLANLKFSELSDYKGIVDELESLGLLFSYTTLLYALGYSEEKLIVSEDNDEDYLELMLKVRDYETGHLTSTTLPAFANYLSYHVKILGVTFEISFPNKYPFMELAESILSTLESFVSTALIDNILPKTPKISIELSLFEDLENLLTHDFKLSEAGYNVELFCHPFSWKDLSKKSLEVLNEKFYWLIIDLIDKFARLKKSEDELQKMFVEEMTLTRSLSLNNCVGGMYNIFGENSCNELFKFIEIKNNYPLQRKKSWDDAHKKKSASPQQVLQLAKSDSGEALDPKTIKHSQITMSQLINEELWNVAKWQGIAFVQPPNALPILMLLFNNYGYGQLIIKGLQAILSSDDSKNRLRISIIKGINKNNPSHYRVMISENILTEKSNKLITMISRIHTLTPSNSKNLEKFESSYNSLHSFYVTAGSMNNEGIKFYENFDTLLILKKDIFIVNAWEITVNDIEKIALFESDEVIVPPNVENAPYLEIFDR